MGRSAGLGSLDSDHDRPLFSVQRRIEYEGDWACGNGWRFCGNVRHVGPRRDNDLRGECYGTSLSRILTGTWGTKRFLGAFHLREWLDDSPLLPISVVVLVHKSAEVLKDETANSGGRTLL